MKYIIRLDRLAAWLLFFCVIAYFISGYGMTKGIIDPALARIIHIQILPYIVLVGFIIHASFGIHAFFKRWRIWNLGTKILLVSSFVALIVLFIWINLFYTKTSQVPQVQNSSNKPNEEVLLDSKEIAKHNNAGDCWLLINNKVYNATSYIYSHPGGSEMIISYCGKEATQAYDTKNIGRPHSASADSILANYYIGDFNQIVNKQKDINPTNSITPPAKNNDDDEYGDD